MSPDIIMSCSLIFQIQFRNVVTFNVKNIIDIFTCKLVFAIILSFSIFTCFIFFCFIENFVSGNHQFDGKTKSNKRIYRLKKFQIFWQVSLDARYEKENQNSAVNTKNWKISILDIMLSIQTNSVGVSLYTLEVYRSEHRNVHRYSQYRFH